MLDKTFYKLPENNDRQSKARLKAGESGVTF